MNEKFKTTNDKKMAQFGILVGKKATQKIKARDNPANVWFGLGMMGLIGWSVATPTIAGIIIGKWLDKIYPEGHSWTLILLIVGLFVGCLNSWHWVSKQYYDMHEEQGEQVNDNE